MNISTIAKQLNCTNEEVQKLFNKNNNADGLSKNQSVTRLVNFRFRLSDLQALDDYASECNVSRTKAIEDLINKHCLND